MIVLWIILGILGVIFLIVILALFLKTNVYITYKNEHLKIRFRNGILRYTLKQKQKKEKPKEEPSRENISRRIDSGKKRLTDKTSFLWVLLGEMRYRIEVKKVKIRVDFGTGDPADTGILYGAIWAAIGSVYQILNMYLVFDFPETEINPDFENKIFKTEFEGIIRLRLVHLIRALAKSKIGKR